MKKLLLPRWSTLGHLAQFGHFFFPLRGGELLKFGNDFAESWGHTHGICSTFGQWYIALQTKVFRVILFHFGAKFRNIMLWVLIPPLGKGYLSLILCPFFVCKEKQFPRAVPRVNPRGRK